MTFFAQILNFLILVAILRAVAYKPIVRIMQEREDKIAESLKKADSDVAEAEKLKADYQRQLAGAREKAQEIVDKAEKVAAQNRDASLESTRQEVERLRNAAKAEIERDRERAQDQMKKEVVALSLLAAGKVVGKKVGSAEDEALVGDFIDKLDKDKIGDLPC